MTEKCITNSRYIYMHETGKSPPQTADIHHVVARKNDLWKSIVCFSAFALLLIAFCVLLGEDKSASTLLLYFGVGAFFIKLMRRNVVEKESVVIIPAFGVQLETHYRRVSPLKKILSIKKKKGKETVVSISLHPRGAGGFLLDFTHFGRVVRCFVPIDNILKPVLNECVTPVTCYWSLALILREEEKLTLVFKASRPPLKMLLPVWEALCAATETGESRG